MPFIYRPTADKRNATFFPLGQYFGNRYEANDVKLNQLVPGFIGNVADSICLFADSDDLEQTGSGAWRFKKNVLKTLETSAIDTVNREVYQGPPETADITGKIADLIKTFRTDPPLPSQQAREEQDKDYNELQAMPWPNKPAGRSDINIPYKNQLCAGSATGFYVGNNLVLTAGHVADYFIKNFQLESRTTLLIFGFKGEFSEASLGTDIPETKVFRVVSVKAFNYEKSTLPGIGMFGGGPNNAQIDAATAKYDVGILEITPATGGSNVNLKALNLCPYLPSTQPPVYLSGHPAGLSQKVSVGGHIITTPEKGKAQRGTFSADLDCFKGNSGGPVLTAPVENGEAVDFANTVVGLVTSGDSSLFATSSEGSDVVASTLLTQVNAYGRLRNGRSSRKGQAFTSIDNQWISCYTELQQYNPDPTMANKYALAYQRFPNTGLLMSREVYTRTDPFRYFTSSIQDFLKPLRSANDRPYGEISVSIHIDCEPGSILAAQGARLDIKNQSNWLPFGNSSPNGTRIGWTKAAGQANVAAAAVMPQSMLTAADGVCGWQMIRLSGHSASDLSPLIPLAKDGTVGNTLWIEFDAEFKISNPCGTRAATEWVPGTEFTFHVQVPLKYSQPRGYWEGQIGFFDRGDDSRTGWWTGPELASAP